MRAAIVLAALVSCGHAAPATVDVTATHALVDAVKLIRAGQLEQAEQRLAVERERAREEPRRLEQVDYYLATVLVYQGDLVAAEHLIAAHVQAAAARHDGESAVWMTSSLAWLLWARGDTDGALLAAKNGLAAAEELDPEEKRAWSARLLWQRAFFLIDGGREGAAEARAEVDRLGPAETNGQTALRAYAQLRAGDGASAAASARNVHVDGDSDLATTYAVALVLDSTGDHEGAARVLGQITTKVGLLTPLFARRARQ
jgi:hypothetical protein